MKKLTKLEILKGVNKKHLNTLKRENIAIINSYKRSTNKEQFIKNVRKLNTLQRINKGDVYVDVNGKKVKKEVGNRYFIKKTMKISGSKQFTKELNYLNFYIKTKSDKTIQYGIALKNVVAKYRNLGRMYVISQKIDAGEKSEIGRAALTYQSHMSEEYQKLLEELATNNISSSVLDLAKWGKNMRKGVNVYASLENGEWQSAKALTNKEKNEKIKNSLFNITIK